MQKKILASLLVTPLAFNAMANITIVPDLVGGGEGWSQDGGVTGSDPIFNGTGLSCPLTGGVLTTTVAKKLNPGNYKIEFTNPDNIKVEVKAGDTVLGSTLTDGAVAFEVTATGTEITVSVQSADQINGFGFEKAGLVLDVNFAEIQTALNENLAAVLPVEIAPEDDRAEAEALRNTYAELKGRYDALAAAVAELNTESIGIYNKYQLWADPNVIQQGIDQIKASVEEYNEAAEAENAVWEVVKANREAKAALEASITDLEANLAAQKTALDAAKAETVPSTMQNAYNANLAASDEAYTKAAAALEAFKAAVVEAYADETKKDIECEDQTAAVQLLIDAIGTVLDTAKADWTAYKALMDLQAQLVDKADKTKDAIAAIKGEDDPENAFAAYIAAQQAKVNEIYQSAMEAVTVKNGNAIGAAEAQEADTKTITDAIAEMDALLTAAKEYADAQNAAYTGVMTDVDALQEELNSLRALVLPKEQAEAYQALVKEAQGLIDSLKEKIAADMASATGLAESYDTEITAIQEAIQQLKDFNTAWEPFVQLRVNYYGLQGDVKDLQAEMVKAIKEALEMEESDELSLSFDLSKKFTSTYNIILDAINAISAKIENGKDVSVDIANVQKIIDDTKANAEQLKDAYQAAYVALYEFKIEKDALDKAIADKLIVEGSTWTAAAFTSGADYTTLDDQFKAFDAALKTADEANAQEAYATATQLFKDINGYGWSNELQTVAKAFEDAATVAGNYTAVDNAIKALKEFAANDGEDFYGKSELDFSELEDALTAISGDITAQQAAETVNYEEWAKIDTALNELLGKVTEKKAEVNALIDNQAAADALTALLPTDDKLQELIDYNEANSLTPAKEYYNGVINGDAETSLASRKAAIAEEIQKALEDGTIGDKKVYDALNGKIGVLNSDIEQMISVIDDNNTNHDAQLLKSEEVRTHIQGLLTKIGEQTGDDAADLVSEWTDKLQGLLDTDLTNVDLDVNKAYGSGESKAQNASLIKRYEDILAEADKVFLNFDEQIPNTNNKTVTDAEWTVSMADMDAAYNAAIKKYNSFFSLDNVKYREYILETVKTHQPIYEYSAAIAQLKADVKKFIDEHNGLNPEVEASVFSAAEFKAAATDKADQIIADINAKVEKMMQDANAAALTYYADLHADAAAAIQGAEQAMTDAGISEEIITKYTTVAKNNLKGAEDQYKADNAEADFSLQPMDAIATLLDAVSANIDIQAAAQEQWAAYYTEAKTTLDELTEQLGSGIVDSDDESIATLAGYVAEAADLNTTAKADKALVTNLVADKADLDAIVEKAQQLVDEKQQIADDKQDNDDQKKVFEEALEAVNLDLDALKEFAAALAGGGNYDFSSIESLIAYYESLYTERYPQTLIEHKGKIEAALNNAKAAINNAYGKIQAEEQHALVELPDKTKVAFNNAKVLGDMTDEALVEANAAINEYDKAITDLAGIVVPDKKDDYRTQAVELEGKLSALYVQLMSSFESEDIESGNPVPGILAGLDAQYDEVSAAITEAEQYLAGCLESVQEDEAFKGKYEEMAAQLDAVKSAYQAEGDNIVLTEETYATQIDNIKAAVEALQAQIEAAQAQAEHEKAIKDANDAAYTALSEQIAAYMTQIAELKTEAEEHGVYTGNVEAFLSNAEVVAGWAQEDIDDLNERVALTAESTLPYKDYLEEWINKAIQQMELAYVNNLITETANAISDAQRKIAGNLVPDLQSELNNKLVELQNRESANWQLANDTYNAYLSGDITIEEYKAKMHEVAEEYLAIIEAANALETEAVDNTVVLGDVDLNPDGEVTVVDLQILIGWIGEGMTYEQLYEESPRQACAADINGSKDLNVADVAGIINIIMNKDVEIDATAAPALAPSRHVVSGDGLYSLEMLTSENNTRDYVMAVTGVTEFAAAQMDITLPSGMTLESAQLADTSTDHEVAVFDNGAGSYRLVIYSMTNSTVGAMEGVMLHITTTGVGNPEMSGVIISDAQGNAMSMKPAGTSMLDSIINGATNLRDRIYNVAGQTMRSIQRGINIIRHSDGSVTKELH